jgi:hypothetical protein
MEAQNVEFHVAEYSALRSELQFNIRSAIEAVLYSLIANALIVSWIASLNPAQGSLSNFAVIASTLPLVLTILAWAIFRQRMSTVTVMADYCRLLETKLALEGLGWQKFVADARTSRLFRSRYIYTGIFLFQLILSGYLLTASLRNYYGV